MSRLVALGAGDAAALVQDGLGTTASSLEGMAEALRAEVSARGACGRAATLRRVAARLASAVTVDADALADACDGLERDGDLVLAPGGVLHATPLRAIELGGGLYRVVTSLPRGRLTTVLEGRWTVVGTVRVCAVDDVERARAQVAAVGGVVMDGAAWSRLDRVPLADERWLASLDRWLMASAGPPRGSGDEVARWNGLVADPDGVRWHGEETSTCRLWRGRDRWGIWRHAWTQGSSPRDAPSVTLSSDDATRAYFAVAREAGAPLTVTVTRDADATILAIEHWLPAAEHRYLSISATPAGPRGRWMVAPARLASVLEVLTTRVGLRVREEAAS